MQRSKFKKKSSIANKPSSDVISTTSALLERVTYRDISGVGDPTVSVKADPYSQVIPNAYPYKVINYNNPIITGNFGDRYNLLGNTLLHIATDSNSSLAQVYDHIKFNVNVNYLYLPFTGTNGMNYEQLKKSVTEAISKAYSETFINLSFFDLEFNTDTGFPGAPTDKGTDTTDLLALTSIYYQSVLQQAASIFNKMNSLLSIEQHLLNMNWNRYASVVTANYGLLKKQAFFACFEAVANILEGEYFDYNWFKQTAAIINVMSRKSESMWDPLVEISAKYNRFPFSLKRPVDGSSYDTIYDSNKTYSVKTGSKTETQQTLWQILDYVVDNLSAYKMNQYARTKTPSAFKDEVFNPLTWYMEALTTALADFKVSFETFRTVLDVMNRVKLNRWAPAPRFNLLRNMQYKPFYNEVVMSLLKSAFIQYGGFSFDPQTYRWSFYSYWDKTFGYPSYDKMLGGAALTLSTRNINNDTVSKFNLLLPQWFVPDTTMTALNRSGVVAVINKYTVTKDKIANSVVYGRLSFFSAKDPQDLVIPKINYESEGTKAQVSWGYQLLNNLFGFGIIEIGGSSTTTNDFILNPDVIGFLDLEMDGINNAMLDYYRAMSPFSVLLKPVVDLGLGRIS